MPHSWTQTSLVCRTGSIVLASADALERWLARWSSGSVINGGFTRRFRELGAASNHCVFLRWERKLPVSLRSDAVAHSVFTRIVRGATARVCAQSENRSSAGPQRTPSSAPGAAWVSLGWFLLGLAPAAVVLHVYVKGCLGTGQLLLGALWCLLAVAALRLNPATASYLRSSLLYTLLVARVSREP